MIKRILFITLGIFLAQEIVAQDVQGIIIYQRKTDWVSIMSRLPYMTQEEIDRNRLTWGKRSGRGRNYNLFVKGNKSLYTYGEFESESRWSRKSEAYLLLRDHKSKKAKDVREILGKKYLVKDEIPKLKWKILNEIKEVEGYLCMKAETINKIKGQTVHAWFTDGINFFGGPEGYSGLPGMILELVINDGDVVVTATSVSLEETDVKLPVPKKMKGKEITFIDFDIIVKDFIDKSIEGERNPFWRIRY
ncbi:MAG: GLPGLI family protein [Saprospiraceae bacterium]